MVGWTKYERFKAILKENVLQRRRRRRRKMKPETRQKMVNLKITGRTDR